MEMDELAEVGLVALTIVAIGVVISVVAVVLSRRHQQRRHRRISASRRKAKTEFDLALAGTASETAKRAWRSDSRAPADQEPDAASGRVRDAPE